MARRAAISLHVALSALGVLLYLLFIIPRWWVLTGDFPVTLGLIGRIGAGVPIAAAAVPVVLNLQRAVKPGSATPELALRLRAWSAALHVLSGALILITALIEIWLPLTSAGPWLFAAYGAAGAVAILAIAAFYLSFIAEEPPRPPKPPKAKKAKPEKPKKVKPEKAKKRGKRHDGATPAESGTDDEATEPGQQTDTAAEAAGDEEESEETPAPETPGSPVTIGKAESADSQPDDNTAETLLEAASGTAATERPGGDEATHEPAKSDAGEGAGGLRNKRPSGKVRHRLRR